MNRWDAGEEDCMGVARASRRALRALLRMRYFLDGIKKNHHPEEAA